MLSPQIPAIKSRNGSHKTYWLKTIIKIHWRQKCLFVEQFLSHNVNKSFVWRIHFRSQNILLIKLASKKRSLKYCNKRISYKAMLYIVRIPIITSSSLSTSHKPKSHLTYGQLNWLPHNLACNTTCEDSSSLELRKYYFARRDRGLFMRSVC